MTDYNIVISPVPGSYGYFIEYRRDGTSVWIAPTTFPNPTLLTTYPISLDETYGYDIRVSSNNKNCTSAYRYTRIEAGTPSTTYIWIGDTTTCEQDESFTLVTEYTGFSSPLVTYYDQPTDRVYVADQDRAAGNAYYFTPGTFTGVGDIVGVSGLTDRCYTALADAQYRRMYFVGKGTGGLKSLAFATNTFTSVAYGTDAVEFNRTVLIISGTNIYTYDEPSNTIYIIARSSLALTNTIPVSGIPSNSIYITGSFDLHSIAGNLWLTSQFKANGNIAVYNSTLTALVATITLPGIAVETSGRYRQTSYYDEPNNRFYISDAGSGKLFIIDTISRTIVKTITFDDKEGKTYVSTGVVVDPTNGEFFIAYGAYNTPGEGGQINRMYKWNKSTLSFSNIFPNTTFSTLSPQTGTSLLWGAAPRVPIWAIPNTGYNTDGSILKYTK